jgi:hypothetical protein
VTLLANTVPEYKLVVTNTGNATLSGVTVTDPMFGNLPVFAIGDMPPNDVEEIFVNGTWSSGTVSNTASVNGTNQTTTVTDSDPAFYIGTFPLVPAIDIEKFIKDANGVWQVRVSRVTHGYCASPVSKCDDNVITRCCTERLSARQYAAEAHALVSCNTYGVARHSMAFLTHLHSQPHGR